jgi:hypothetical protein
MHHTAAYYGTVAQTSEIDLPALADNYLVIQNSHFLPQVDMPLLYAGAFGTLLTRARISTPSLAKVTTPWIRDISPALGAGSPMLFANYSDDPIVLKALEEVTQFQTDSAVTSESNAAILGLQTQPVPRPAGNIYTIRGTGVGTLTVGAWSSIGTITWQNTLPQGQYAILGAVFNSAGAIAGRLIIPGVPYRPGGLAVQSITARTDRLFRNGLLGVWGYFNNYAMPSVEILSGSADTSEEVYLDIARITGN